MASESGPVATEAPLVLPSAQTTSTLPPPASLDALAADAARGNSLKRPRDEDAPAATAAHSELSPSKLARLVDSTRYSAGPLLTGQAALEDEQRRREEEARLHPPDATSENPALKALSALRGAEALMSRANEAPASGPALADAAAKAVSAVAIPTTAVTQAEQQANTSPQSATSGQTLGSTHQVVHSPGPMDVDSRNDRVGYALQPEAQMEEKAGAMSYPGILPPGGAMPAPAAPQRGMSLPMANSQNPDLAPRSPSSKKHKCPYCDTEFTRHHNLKSHLLTHSQEKPYVCSECQMRFRRLHDLKRHSKLHTGEKPHICPKCDRKFARGDALARHSKGQGGCAGRRASMGSFGGDDDYDGAPEGDDSTMSGVVYDNSEADMTEEERRRLSLPSIKAQHVSGGATAPENYASHSRTYPPAGARAATSGAAIQGHPPTAMSQAPAVADGLPAVHSRTSSGPSHVPSGGSGDSSANLFSNDSNLWSYIQSLEARMRLQDQKIGEMAILEDKLKQRDEEIATLRTTVQNHETQIVNLTTRLSFLPNANPHAPQEAQEVPATRA